MILDYSATNLFFKNFILAAQQEDNSYDAVTGAMGYFDSAGPGWVPNTGTSTISPIDIGVGGPPLAIWAWNEAAVDVNATTTLMIKLYSDNVTTFASRVQHWATAALLGSTYFKAGVLRLVGVIPPGCRRYLAASITVGAANWTTGSLTVGIAPLLTFQMNGAANFNV